MRELADELNAMATELRSHDHMQQEELELARKIQRNLLPAAMPSLSGLRVVTNRRQAEHVSGDMYDAFELPNGTSAILLFNVTGHGIAAALLAGLVRMSLRYRSSETLDPGKALDAANKDITKAMSESEFVTACVGIWNAHDLTWSYAAAGSQCGVLLANGKSSRLECSGPSLGASYKGQWQTRVISLDAASRLFLYTDYLVKATATECCVDLPDLENLLATTGNLELEEQAATVLEVLRDLCIKSHSNMTLIGLEVLP
jgi:serine phosphatase RsbU (regulator of sigma subunit)